MSQITLDPDKIDRLKARFDREREKKPAKEKSREERLKQFSRQVGKSRERGRDIDD